MLAMRTIKWKKPDEIKKIDKEEQKDWIPCEVLEGK